MIWNLSRAEPQSRGGSFASKGRFGNAELEGRASICENAEEMKVVFLQFGEFPEEEEPSPGKDAGIIV